MNFVGDRQQLKTMLTGDIVYENAHGQDFIPGWNGGDLIDSRPYTTSLPFSMTWYDEASSFSPGRLDYHIFSGSVFEELNSFALFTPALPQDSLSLYGLQVNDSKIASDHLPVVIDLKLSNVTAVQEPLEHIIEMNIRQAFNTLVLTFPTADASIFIDIYNVQGKKMASRKVRLSGIGTIEEFDLNKFANGMYMVSAQSKQKKIAKAFVLGDR